MKRTDFTVDAQVRVFHAAGDYTEDLHDHDEYHAAAETVRNYGGISQQHPCTLRWIDGLWKALDNPVDYL